VRTGTVVRAWRRQIGIKVLWDGDDHPSNYRHDDAVNPADDAIDMLDGRGIPLGARVEELPEGRLRLTGEIVEAEAEPEPRPARGLDTPEKFVGWAKTLSAAGKADAWMLANGFETPHAGPVMPLDPDEEEALLR
jgi:hypothetical protein